SAEVDVYWGLETETDYRMTKGTGWLEIMGCGMVDPNVLRNCGIDPEVYSGFAFGMGIDRIALLLHQISDIRLLSENDVRFLEQFKSGLYPSFFLPSVSAQQLFNTTLSSFGFVCSEPILILRPEITVLCPKQKTN